MFTMFRKPYALLMISLILSLVASTLALPVSGRIVFGMRSLWRLILAYSSPDAGILLCLARHSQCFGSISAWSVSIVSGRRRRDSFNRYARYDSGYVLDSNIGAF
jgi:hypothetical protein